MSEKLTTRVRDLERKLKEALIELNNSGYSISVSSFKSAEDGFFRIRILKEEEF